MSESSDEDQDPGISREEAEKLLRENIKSDTLFMHCREAEVVARALAKEIGESEDFWGIAALLHDVDYEIEEVQENPEIHGVLAKEILEKAGVNPAIIHAIQAHNHDYTGVQPVSNLDYGVIAAEQITGLIYATTLVYPDKKLASVRTESILKRFKKKDFARKVNRDEIRNVEKIGVSLERFAEIALKAMKKIAGEVGL